MLRHPTYYQHLTLGNNEYKTPQEALSHASNNEVVQRVKKRILDNKRGQILEIIIYKVKEA